MAVAESFVCRPSTLLTAGIAVPLPLASAATLKIECDIVAICALWRVGVGFRHVVLIEKRTVKGLRGGEKLS